MILTGTTPRALSRLGFLTVLGLGFLLPVVPSWGQSDDDEKQIDKKDVIKKDIIKKLKDEGHDVYPISNEQLAEWKKAAEPLEKSWADNVTKAGGDPDAIMKELKASMAKYNAAY